MGLDIYLYRYENYEDTIAREKQYEDQSEKNWEAAGKYESLTDSQKDEIREKNKAFALSIGLDEDGSCPNKTKIEEDSEIDKDHYFKIGYFRSSYNDSGIERVLSNLGVPGLKEIFNPNDQYDFQPDWNKAFENCNKSIELLESKGNYRCFDVSANIFGNNPICKSEKEAMDLFIEETKRKTSMESYSSSKGHFFLKEPLKIFALLVGTNNILVNGVPCTYVICEGENQWYINALKIVRETIEYVLAKDDKEKYYLHWSG